MFWKKKKKEENYDITFLCKNYLKNYILNVENKPKSILHDYEKYLVFRRGMETIEKENEKDDQNMQKIHKEISSFYQKDKVPENLKNKSLKPHNEEEEKFYSFLDKELKNTESKEYKFQIKMKNSTSDKFYQETFSPKSNYLLTEVENIVEKVNNIIQPYFNNDLYDTFNGNLSHKLLQTKHFVKKHLYKDKSPTRYFKNANLNEFLEAIQFKYNNSLPLYTNLKILREMKNFDNRIKEEFASFGAIAAPLMTSVLLLLKKKAIFHKYQHIKVYFGIVFLSNIGIYLLINNSITRYFYMKKFIKEYDFDLNKIFAEFSYEFEGSNKELTLQKYNLLYNNSDLLINKQDFEDKLKTLRNNIDLPNIDHRNTINSKTLGFFSYLKFNFLMIKYERNMLKETLNIIDYPLTKLVEKYELIYNNFEMVKNVIFTRKVQEEQIHRYILYYAEFLYHAYSKIEKASPRKNEKITISISDEDLRMKKSKNTLEILNYFYRRLNCYDNEQEALMTKILFDIMKKIMNNRKNELNLIEIKHQYLKMSSKISKLYELYPVLVDYMENDKYTELVRHVFKLSEKDNYSLISLDELQTIKNQFCDYDFKTYSHLHLLALTVVINYLINFKLFNLLRIKKF